MGGFTTSTGEEGVRAEAHVSIGSPEPAPACPSDGVSGVQRLGGVSPEEHRGLCESCALRGTCRLPKPEGGVWRCRYYE
jgi:hypothetical protein